MIFIAAKFQVLPDHADACPEIAADFTAATAASQAPCGSTGRAAQQTLPPHLAETPRIVNVAVPQNDWSPRGTSRLSRVRAGVGTAGFEPATPCSQISVL
jgi:hypothetical protein